MISKTMPSIIQMEEESLQHLVSEVKETIARNINREQLAITDRKFGITDMWNSQRNVRTAASRRRHLPKVF